MQAPEKVILPYCAMRHANDTAELAGKRISPRCEPLKGYARSFDPCDDQLREVKHHRELLIQQREERMKKKLYK